MRRKLPAHPWGEGGSSLINCQALLSRLWMSLSPECQPLITLILGFTASQGIGNTVPETGDQLPQG